MQGLLFDLDGTLTDPFEGIAASVRHALKQLGVASPDDQALRGWIGPPLWDSFGRYLQSDDPALLKQAIGLYRERFADQGLFENRVYPGIPALLDDLRAAGFRLVLATSKPRVFAERILAHFALDRYFHAVHGSELDGTHAHKAELIRYILGTEQLRPDSTLMIGDRHHDIHGAHHNGVRAVGVGWGYGSVAELDEAGAEWIADSPGALGRWLRAAVAIP